MSFFFPSTAPNVNVWPKVLVKLIGFFHYSLQSKVEVNAPLFCRQLKLKYWSYFTLFLIYQIFSIVFIQWLHTAQVSSWPYSAVSIFRSNHIQFHFDIITFNFFAKLSFFPYYSFLLNVIWICHRETRRQPTIGFLIRAWTE